MDFPKLYKVKQHFDTTVVEDIPKRIIEELDRVGAYEQIRVKKLALQPEVAELKKSILCIKLLLSIYESMAVSLI